MNLLLNKSNEIINELRLENSELDKLNKELKKKIGAYNFLIDVENKLISEGHDIRMEELILNLENQLIDNPEWLKCM